MSLSPEEERAAYKLALAHDYGQYECGNTPIFIGGARAFNPGQPVPASHVEKYPEIKAQVVKVDDPAPKPTKAAVAAESEKKDA